MTGRPYVCGGCGGEFLTTVSDEAAAAEAEQLFGKPVPEEDREVLCDDCYRKFVAWFETLTPEDHRAIRAGEVDGFS